MKTQGPFSVDSPGKVTLHLRILRRRSDGYHDVRIALAPVALYDRLWFDLAGAAGLSLATVAATEAPQTLGPAERNLVLRAARAFEEALGERLSAALRLEKHIPVGAGLGGGSGNAAATLVALNRWYGHPVGPERLETLAAGLGADVPFFLEPRPAWAEGIGEHLTPIVGLPRLPLLVVKPALSISTAEAYGCVRAEEDGGPAPAAVPTLQTVDGVVASLFNAFEAALLPRYPELGRIKAALAAAGARGAVLSGSGSAVCGVFADATTRDSAAMALAAEAASQGWRLLPCHTLAAHRYDQIF